MGLIVGFAVGYYLGAMAGRERYQQLNRMIGRLRRSDAMDAATGKAKTVIDLGYEKVREEARHKLHHDRNGGTNSASEQPTSFSPS